MMNIREILGSFIPLRYTRSFVNICLIVAGRRQVTSQRLTNTFILNLFHVTKMLIQRCHVNFFDNSFRLTSEKKAKAPLYWSFEMVTGGFLSQRDTTTLQSNAENVSVSWRHHATSHRWAPSLMIDSLHLCFHYHDYHNFLCLCVWNSCILSFYWYGYRGSCF